MPNWCYNSLVVEGESDALNHFKEKAKGKGWQGDCPNELDFNQFVPMPQETIDEGYSDCGYDWEIENWGVKWGACEVCFEELGDEIQYAFETAWTAPTPMMEKWSSQYPMLTFSLSYEEPGQGFYGSIMCFDGEIMSEECHDMTTEVLHENGYHDDPEEHPECEECSKYFEAFTMDKIKKQIDQDYE